MKNIRKLTTVGNSLGITLPTSFVERLDLKKGDIVEMMTNGDVITVKKVVENEPLDQGLLNLIQQEIAAHTKVLEGLANSDKEHTSEAVAPLSEREIKAVNAALSVIYLGDNSDYINGLWDVLRALSGDDVVDDDSVSVYELTKRFKTFEEDDAID